MATNYNARIATRGLALSVDAANPASLSTNIRRNLIAQSENLSNAAWNKQSIDAILTTVTAPDGSSTVYSVNEQTNSAQHLLAYNFGTVVINDTFTWSGHFKNNTNTTQIILHTFGEGTVTFNIGGATAGTVAGTGGANTLSSSIVSLGNGWYRCAATFRKANNNGTFYVSNQNGLGVYVGNTGISYYAWGLQLEYSSAVSNYYPVSALDSNLNTRWNDLTGTSRLITTAIQGSGQIEYTTAGSYSFLVPDGVTSISAVAVGAGGGGGSTGGSGGGGGGGGGLGWKNNITVIPGQSYTVVVGIGGTGDSTTNGGASYFIDLSTVAGLGGLSSTTDIGGTGGSFVGDGGGNGGTPNASGISDSTGGGGAGGYSGNGGGSAINTNGTAGSGGGGGGGAAGGSSDAASGGGGVGLLGQGTSGAGGIYTGSDAGAGGGGGSGGFDGGAGTSLPNNSGGLYGGGGGGAELDGEAGNGAGGAVRIIWGVGRSYPVAANNIIPVPSTTISTNVSYGSFVNVTTPILYDSRNSGALVFNNLDNYVAFPDLSSQTNSPLSVFAWVFLNATPVGTNGIWGHYGVNNNNIHYEINPTATRLRLGDTNKADLPMLAVGSWQFVGFTSTGSTHRYYVNGVLSTTWAGATGTILGGNGTFPSSHMIGRSDATRTWNGRIAQVAIYNAELTATEVLNNFNALRGRYAV
jgi:hypothetical protein